VRTQVGIIGAGPAGLMLSHLLDREGIESVVLEKHSRDYVTQRVRAGVLEAGTVATLTAAGLGDRLAREGLVHRGIELRFGGVGHWIDLADLTGKTITIYGQQEVVKDLIEARLARSAALHFDVPDVRLGEADAERLRVHGTVAGRPVAIECDFVAGCDGFHGISRESLPPTAWRGYQRDYPFAWLGILVEAPPSAPEVVYANHEQGFALHSMRSLAITRLYLQCGRDDTLDRWPDERIWSELHARLASPGWQLTEGPIIERGIAPLRSFVAEPMRHGNLFLAGDAAHIVPPTGAKGLNLAIADVAALAAGLTEWYRHRSPRGLNEYSAAALRRVWRAQAFTSQMTSLLHRFPDHDEYDRRRQRAELDYVTRSRAAATALAENYVGAAP
jgi:p-hydroxybenzoate 3-monooxygenase